MQNILKENSGKADGAYEEIRKRLETASVVGAEETGAAVGKHLHWNWIFQNDLLTYVFQSESRGQKAIDSKFPKGLPYSTLVTDRHQSYFKMNVKDHQVTAMKNGNSKFNAILAVVQQQDDYSCP